MYRLYYDTNMSYNFHSIQVVALFLLTRGSDICGITSTLAVAFHRFIILRFDPFNKRNLVTGPRLIATCILLWVLAVGPLFALQFIVYYRRIIFCPSHRPGFKASGSLHLRCLLRGYLFDIIGHSA